MSDFLKNDIFEVFQAKLPQMKASQPKSPTSSQKKLMIDNNPQRSSNPMEKLEETLMEIEEEKDSDFKDLNEKEKDLQKMHIA